MKSLMGGGGLMSDWPLLGAQGEPEKGVGEKAGAAAKGEPPPMNGEWRSCL